MKLYEVLGITPKATADEIKAAYRSLSRKYHPDRKDGDTAKQQQINDAYAVLGDPERRRRYDHADCADFLDIEKEATEAIKAGFRMGVETNKEPLIECMRDSLESSIEQTLNEIQRRKAHVAILNSKLKRVRRRSPGNNLHAEVIQKSIDGLMQDNQKAERYIRICKLVGVMLDDYEDVKDSRSTAVYSRGGFFGL